MKRILTIALLSLAVVSCMKYGPREEESFSVDLSARGLFVLCEGNYMYGNASLTYYDPASRRAENEVFVRSNAFPIGDVLQSMRVRGGLCYAVVNNSGVIFAIDPSTFREKGRITGFTSPRYIHFVSDSKAYVTQIWDPRICIVDLDKYSIAGYVATDMDFETGSTEMMVQIGKYIYINCWSYQNRILRLNTETDTIDAYLEVGLQPSAIVADSSGLLWVITDGGYEGSPYGYEAPTLSRIDPETFTVERTFTFPMGSTPRSLVTGPDARSIYWINGGVYKMDTEAATLPSRPIIEGEGSLYYSMTVDPENGEIYVSDAIDYTQNGVVNRYSADGASLLDTFTVGVNPGGFCWREAQ